jgi:hypothetical protein
LVAVGIATGVAVTLRAHRAPTSPGWAQRVGRTRLRRSDLPVGFTVALLAAFVLNRLGKKRAAQLVAAWGLGAGIGAVGTGLAEPLEPVRS